MVIVFGFCLRQIWLRLTGRFNRFGYAGVNFGQPISLRSFIENSTKKSADRNTVLLGRKIMGEISKAIPVLPVPLVAFVIKSSDNPMKASEIYENCYKVLAKLRSSNVRINIPEDRQAYIIEHAVETLLKRRALKRVAAGIMIDNSDGELINFYANSITHLLTDDH